MTRSRTEDYLTRNLPRPITNPDSPLASAVDWRGDVDPLPEPKAGSLAEVIMALRTLPPEEGIDLDEQWGGSVPNPDQVATPYRDLGEFLEAERREREGF